MGRRRVDREILNNQRGQFLIEGILLMVLSIGLLTVAVRTLRDRHVISTIVGGAWAKTAGMAESGVWQTASNARRDHPNGGSRGRLVDPTK